MAKQRARVSALKDQWEKIVRRHPPPDGPNAQHAVIELDPTEYDFLMICAAGYLAMREMGESYAAQLQDKSQTIDSEFRALYGDTADGVIVGKPEDEG